MSERCEHRCGTNHITGWGWVIWVLGLLAMQSLMLWGFILVLYAIVETYFR